MRVSDKNSSTFKIKPLAGMLTACLALSTVPAEAGTIFVDSTLDNLIMNDGLCTLREAVISANGDDGGDSGCNDGSGADSIIFDLGVGVTGTVGLQLGQIDIGNNFKYGAITIDRGFNNVTISGSNNSRVFGIGLAQKLTLKGITIEGGKTTGNSSGVTFCESAGVASFTKGGAICTEGSLVLEDSTIRDSSTAGDDADGGAIYAAGNITLINSTISGNRISGASAEGGGIYALGDATLINSTVSDNNGGGSSQNIVGGFHAGESVTLVDSTVSDNVGLGFVSLSRVGVVTLTNSTVSNNHAGFEAAAARVTLTNSIVSSNHRFGGFKVLNSAVVTLTNSTVSDNNRQDLSGEGGGFYVYKGTVTLTNSVVSGNSSDGAGGGFYVGKGTVTLTNSVVSGNSSGERGGGFYVDMESGDVVSLANSTVSGNRTEQNNAGGGGFYIRSGHNSSLALINSTVSGNSTAGENSSGGGFYNQGGGSITLKNSTISGNIANDASAIGDGAHLAGGFAPSTISLNSSILSGNGLDNFSYVTGGGVVTLNVTNSLIGADVVAAINGGNTDNVVNNTPVLVALADNNCIILAGEMGNISCVKTHALGVSSPALDKGAMNGLFLDQRAMPRVSGIAADIGAYELAVPYVVPNPLGECDGIAGINTNDVTCTINKALLLP